MKLISLISICTLSLSTPAVAFEWPAFNLDIAVVGDDNLNRAQQKTDISEDRFYDLRSNASYFFELNPLHALIASGTLSSEKYTDFTGLNKLATGLGLTWQFMTRTGFDAPVYAISLAVEAADYKTDIRDNRNTRLSAEMNQRLTDRITATYGLNTRRSAADSEVFDTRESRLFTNFDYVFNIDTTIYSTLSFIFGDIVSTARPTLNILNWAEVLQPDNAFGGISDNAIAYRLDARTRVLSLGINYAINEHHSLDFSSLFIKAAADGNIEYDRTQFRASYLTRF